MRATLFFFRVYKIIGRTETRTRDRMYLRGYDQLETSPEAIEQELRPEVYTITAWQIWCRCCVAHAFVVCNDYYNVCDVFEIS